MSETMHGSDWVGNLIDGRFPLLEWLGSDETGDVFRTELPGSKVQRAAIRLLSVDAEDGQAQFDGWAQSEGISHPNLIRVFESGRGRIDEEEFFYVVMEFPEESLVQILPERALTPEETRDMLIPVLDALAYVHGRGLVHGNVEPRNILVVGDRLKLSSDNLHHEGQLQRRRNIRASDAPELAEGKLSPAADIWSVGVTIIEALTQFPPIWNRALGSEPVVPNTIPDPFRTIAMKCLWTDPAKRCALDEVRKLLATIPIQPAPQTVETPAPALAAYSAAVSTPKPESPTRPASHTAKIASEPRNSKPAKPAQAEFAFDDAMPSRRPLRSVEDGEEPQKPIWRQVPFLVGVGAILFVLIIGLLVRSHKIKPAPAPPAESTAAAPAATPGAAAPLTEAPRRQAQTPKSPAVKGSVASRVVPEVPAKASRSLRGQVNVKVRVYVDRSGDVTNANIESGGRSRYFAHLAQEAARKWKFKPARVDGHNASSVWTLRFEFSKNHTVVLPTEVTP